ADGGVAFAQSGHLAGEALDGPVTAVGRAKLVDIGKIAGARDGDVQRVEDGIGVAQFVIAEAGPWVLNGFVVILRQWPTHGWAPSIRRSMKNQRHVVADSKIVRAVYRLSL